MRLSPAHLAPVSPEGLYAEAIELGHIAARLQDRGEHVAALVAEQEATKHIKACKQLALKQAVDRVEVRAHPGGRHAADEAELSMQPFTVAVDFTILDLLYEQEREGFALSNN